MVKRLRFIRAVQLADIIGPPPKTRVWRVRNVQAKVDLGMIRWLGRWRQYSFHPDAELAFERLACAPSLISANGKPSRITGHGE